MRRRLLKIVLVVAALSLVAYLGVSVAVAYSLTHPARSPLKTTPAQYGLEYEEVNFHSEGDNVPLSGWLVNPRGRPTVVIMHGSGSNRANYINMEVAKALVAHGYSVFLFDFRGQGASGGDTGGLGEWETRDLGGALAYLKERGVDQVGTIGYSMGAATELLAAPGRPEMRAIVADSSFSDLLSMIDRVGESRGIPDIFNPGVLLAANSVFGLDIAADNPKQAVARLGDRPVLLIHATGDDLIPARRTPTSSSGSPPRTAMWQHLRTIKKNT